MRITVDRERCMGSGNFADMMGLTVPAQPQDGSLRRRPHKPLQVSNRGTQTATKPGKSKNLERF